MAKSGEKKKRVTKKKVKDEQGVKRVTELELRSLDFHEARVQMQMTVRENLSMKEELLRIDYTNKRDVLRKKQVETVASMEQAKADHNAQRASIESRLGVSLDKCTIREDGIVIELDDSGNPMTFVEDGADEK